MDAQAYQLLLEFERRLEEKFTQARQQNKEDTQAALIVALQPVNSRLDKIDSRMEAGDHKFTALERRFDDHSDRIQNVNDFAKDHKAECPMRHRGDETTKMVSKDKMEASGGWISAKQLPAIITAIGSLVAVVVSSVALLKAPTTPTPLATHAAPTAQATGPGE
jgi:chromosome segregation ATPase